MTTKVQTRQYPLSAMAQLSIANIGAGKGVDIELPAGAFLKGLNMGVGTAFDSGTTTTVTISDGTVTFANAVTVKATGPVTVTNVGVFYPNGGTISVTLAETGATATAGAAVVAAEYVVLNRQNEPAL